MKQGYQYEQSEQEYIEEQKAGVQIAVTFLNNAKDVLLKMMDLAIAQNQATKSEISFEKICNRLDSIALKMDRQSETKYSCK
jgi:hypothetical protein